MEHDEILELLQAKRKAMGWTQQNIAERSGVSLNMVQRFFAGENISFFKFQDILYGMGIEMKLI